MARALRWKPPLTARIGRIRVIPAKMGGRETFSKTIQNLLNRKSVSLSGI